MPFLLAALTASRGRWIAGETRMKAALRRIVIGLIEETASVRLSVARLVSRIAMAMRRRLLKRIHVWPPEIIYRTGKHLHSL
jgi:hypothetical protein